MRCRREGTRPTSDGRAVAGTEMRNETRACGYNQGLTTSGFIDSVITHVQSTAIDRARDALRSASSALSSREGPLGLSSNSAPPNLTSRKQGQGTYAIHDLILGASRIGFGCALPENRRKADVRPYPVNTQHNVNDVHNVQTAVPASSPSSFCMTSSGSLSTFRLFFFRGASSSFWPSSFEA